VAEYKHLIRFLSLMCKRGTVLKRLTIRRKFKGRDDAIKLNKYPEVLLLFLKVLRWTRNKLQKWFTFLHKYGNLGL
jgi:hypothetical protein